MTSLPLVKYWICSRKIFASQNLRFSFLKYINCHILIGLENVINGKKYTFTGKATEEEITASFLETLGESCSNPNEVSYSEFEDYYEGLSIGIMDDDDFVNILRNPWGI